LLNFKGTCSLNSKKPVSAANAKLCGLSNSMPRPLQKTDNSNELVAVCQFPLSANSGKPIAATIHKTGFQREMLENYHFWI
jgi:hypothetical protein